MSGLHEPLPTVLGSIATAMRSGIPSGTYGKGGGSYNWREIIGVQRAEALIFLRQRVERDSGRQLTIREADHRLLPPQAQVSPIFLVAVCAGNRPEGTVSQLKQGDILYLVVAPNAPAEGVVLRRLN